METAQGVRRRFSPSPPAFARLRLATFLGELRLTSQPAFGLPLSSASYVAP